MDERKQLIVTVIASLAGFLFLTVRFFMPIIKDNMQCAAQYRQLRKDVGTIDEFSKGKLDSLEESIDTATSGLERNFLQESKLRLTEQLTHVPTDANIVFTEITHREPWTAQGYQVFPIDVNMKASFYDLIKYLVGIETSPLLISIDSLSLNKAELEAKSLDIKISFSGFRLIQESPSITTYMEDRYRPLDNQRLEKLLEPVKPLGSERVLSTLRDYNPFAYITKTKIAYPDYETIKLDTLSLRGILHIEGKKAALINDTVVKEGESIAGMEVVEIQDSKVVLMQSGKKYILKMGLIDEEFIKR